MTRAARENKGTAAAVFADGEKLGAEPFAASAPADAAEIGALVAYLNGYRKGRRDALAQSREEAAAERREIERVNLVFRNQRIRVYAASKYPTLNARAAATMIASDLKRDRIRRELEAPQLGIEALRKILGG